MEAEPLKEIGSNDVIRFLKKVFARHGVPELLITDNGPQFYSDKTKAFLDLHDVYVNYYVPPLDQWRSRRQEQGSY